MRYRRRCEDCGTIFRTPDPEDSLCVRCEHHHRTEQRIQEAMATTGLPHDQAARVSDLQVKEEIRRLFEDPPDTTKSAEATP